MAAATSKNHSNDHNSFCICDREIHLDSMAVFTLAIFPMREPFANGTRWVARVHTASTASGSSGTLRPHREVFAVDANGTRRAGAAV